MRIIDAGCDGVGISCVVRSERTMGLSFKTGRFRKLNARGYLYLNFFLRINANRCEIKNIGGLFLRCLNMFDAEISIPCFVRLYTLGYRPIDSHDTSDNSTPIKTLIN